ncbi:flippase-like domain-containing protein [Gandjariella thermophila]|uniref:Integral membrane protein n=1 Tax=Gandjariella thermophila TaxID=1931992 RepID=A0A4D4JB54_9PSEU|nr:flippase-like domain-containing protein [Gandjariella thermophila]GDY31619.1 integral membrane protein [Gandjariella thermophila]
MGERPAMDQPAAAVAEHAPSTMSIGRHPRDVVVLLGAAAVVVLCALVARSGAINPVEVAIYQQVQRIPAASTMVWRVLTWLGGWPGIAVVAAVLLYFRRFRLGLQCAAAGAFAWGLTVVVRGAVGGRSVPGWLLQPAEPHLPAVTGFLFPAGHPAVAAAMVAVAAPYLKARHRGVAWAVVVLVAAADVYLGNNLPLGVFAGAFLGWGIGAIFHLVWGAPGRRTSQPVVCRALRDAGLVPAEVVPLREHLTGPLEFAVTTAEGDRLRVEVVRRMHRRAGPTYRLRRLLASLEVEDEPPLSTTYHEAEHEALVTLFAERAGLRTPPVVLACDTRGSPLLVRRQVEGRRLTELPAEEIDDTLLDAIWAEIATLGRARIAHHDLRAKNFLVDTRGRPWVLNLTFGRIGATQARVAQDVAEALVSLASIVGVERAVASACRALPVEMLEQALEYLQPLALPRRIRSQFGQDRYLLPDLRETLAERTGRPIPGFRAPVRPRTVVTLLLFGAAVYTLLPQLSSMRAVVDSLWRANWVWLVVATVTGLVAIVPAAISVQGSSPTPLPFWRTTVVQVAAAFTGRTTPGGIGFFGINISFMERLGVRRSQAVGVTMLNLSATGAVGVVWCVLGALGVGSLGLLRGVSIPHGWPVLVGVGGALVVAGAVLGSPFGRRHFNRTLLPVLRDLLDTVRQPVRALQLFGGAAAYLGISGLGLATSLAAFDSHVPWLAVLVVFVVGQTLGHIAPIPGGLGAVEALMVAGLTALGIPPTAAVAAVLASRLLTYWLPVLPGIAAFRYLQHHGIV